MEKHRTLNAYLAVAVGTLVVNAPVVALLFGPAMAALRQRRSDAFFWLLPLSFIAAWTWWSFFVPRWRLWAYERVASTNELREKALLAGLVWPKGSFFERTEIKSAAQRQHQEQLERQFP